MSEFTVIWSIDLEAEDYKDAAKKALEIQRDPNSMATVFKVGDTERSWDDAVMVDAAE
jgi:hypothetical protein